MTRFTAVFSIIALTLVVSAASGEEPALRTITVIGSATVHYSADSVRIQFRTRCIEATVDEARQANQKAMKSIDEKLAALKIRDMRTALAPPSTSTLTRAMAVRGGFGNGGGPGGGLGGAAMDPRSVCMQLGTLNFREADMGKMIDAISRIEKTLVDSGAVTPTGNVLADDDMPARLNASGISITMYRADDAEFHEEALTKAVQDALRKGKAIAKGAGVQIKEMVSIVENDPNALPAARVVGPVRTTSNNGELEFTAKVTVKFTY